MHAPILGGPPAPILGSYIEFNRRVAACRALCPRRALFFISGSPELGQGGLPELGQGGRHSHPEERAIGRLQEYLQEYILDAIGEPGRAGVGASLTRGMLGGLAGLYDGGLEAYLAAEKAGLRKRARLPVPVVSIGNLSVGGTGKTPMTQWVCRQLAQEGRRVAVLSRGHGGASQSVRVVSDAAGTVLRPAADAGDEPTLLAQTLPGVPVLVGKDRRVSGREALRRFDLDALILDDGFQFWQLARDLDIVLLDAKRPFGNGFPLPRGLLREPKRHLARAGVVVATRAGGLTGAERRSLTGQVSALAPAARLFFADHRPAGWVRAEALSSPLLPLSLLAGARVAAVSAIAQPQSFTGALARLGASVVYERAWADHRAVSPLEAQAVLADAAKSGADALVMTEKDAVKWPFAPSLPGLPSYALPSYALPIYALRIEMTVDDAAELVRVITERTSPRLSP